MYGGIQIKQRYSLEFKMQIKQQIGIYLNESNKKNVTKYYTRRSTMKRNRNENKKISNLN